MPTIHFAGTFGVNKFCCESRNWCVWIARSFVLFDIFRWENMEINVKTVDLNWTLKSSQSKDRSIHPAIHSIVVVISIRFCTTPLYFIMVYDLMSSCEWASSSSSTHACTLYVHRAVTWVHWKCNQITFQLIRIVIWLQHQVTKDAEGFQLRSNNPIGVTLHKIILHSSAALLLIAVTISFDQTPMYRIRRTRKTENCLFLSQVDYSIYVFGHFS